MIHFNALDFTVCRSEEVISFFWRSVYTDSFWSVVGAVQQTVNNACTMGKQKTTWQACSYNYAPFIHGDASSLQPFFLLLLSLFLSPSCMNYKEC